MNLSNEVINNKKELKKFFLESSKLWMKDVKHGKRTNYIQCQFYEGDKKCMRGVEKDKIFCNKHN